MRACAFLDVHQFLIMLPSSARHPRLLFAHAHAHASCFLFLNPLRNQSPSSHHHTGPLANALQCNTTLTALNLGNNDMGEMGGMALAQALATNTTLMALSLA